MERQGSYALGTLIKPVDDNDEYDADIQIVMNPNPKWEPKDYINQVNRTLSGNKTYADKLRLKTRCVTVDYAGDFHLDVVPRVTIERQTLRLQQELTTGGKRRTVTGTVTGSTTRTASPVAI